MIMKYTKTSSTANAGTVRKATAPSTPSLLDRFEAMGAHGLWVVLGIALLMVAYVYWDYLTFAKVLLYTDIGSDSVNFSYPSYVQMARHWAIHNSATGFSLESSMGMPVHINMWDPSMWLLMWGGAENVPHSLAIIEAIKMLATTVLGFFFFRLQGSSNLTASIGGLCLAFCGYAALTASGWYSLSVEVVLLALGLWAVEYAIARRPVYYMVLPAAMVFIAQNNFVFVVYLAAMLVAYLALRTIEHGTWRERLMPAGITLALMVGGLALSFNQFVALRQQVTESGRAEGIAKSGAVSTYGTNMNVGMADLAESKERTNIILRTYSGVMMGSGNAYKGMMNFLEGPILYIGLPMMLFIPTFLVGTDRRRRVVYGILIAGLIVLMFFPWFRFAFWGFNLDYFREYTLLIGAALLIVSMRGFNAMMEGGNAATRWIPSATALALMLLLMAVGASPTDVDVDVRNTATVLLIGFAVAGSALAITRRPAFLLAFLALTVVDLTLNADATINDRIALKTKDIDRGRLYGDDTRKAVNWIKQHDNSLYRIVKLDPSGPAMHQSLNDAMVMGYNGMIGYQSIHNKYYLRFMEAMGMIDLRNPSDAKWVYKAMYQPYLASALGAKYFIRKGAPLTFDDTYFGPVKQIDSAYIHESKVALPLLVAYDSFITPAQLATMDPFKRELQLFKSAILDPGPAQQYDLAAYPVQNDTATVIDKASIAAMADSRRAMMSVQARTTKDGVSATVTCARASFAVASIAYDQRLRVYVDGSPTPTTIANVGFVGFAIGAGRHSVEIRYE
ncbi:MAG: YfhO family protein [Candidatus Kapabacteria bacterium]|nr:YfhO family protein [Candidatus Kapabacteria bacterium]